MISPIPCTTVTYQHARIHANYILFLLKDNIQQKSCIVWIYNSNALSQFYIFLKEQVATFMLVHAISSIIFMNKCRFANCYLLSDLKFKFVSHLISYIIARYSNLTLKFHCISTQNKTLGVQYAKENPWSYVGRGTLMFLGKCMHALTQHFR